MCVYIYIHITKLFFTRPSQQAQISDNLKNLFFTRMAIYTTTISYFEKNYGSSTCKISYYSEYHSVNFKRIYVD